MTGVFSWITGLIMPNKFIIALSLALTVGGYLLISSYKTNGQLSGELEIAQTLNDLLTTAYKDKLKEFEAIQQINIDLQSKKNNINSNTEIWLGEMEVIKNENSTFDIELDDAFWLLLEAGANSEGLPAN